jgi:hypothetical protein
LVDYFATRDIARTTCANLESNDPFSPPQLLSIKSPPEQEFISKWLFDQHGLLDRFIITNHFFKIHSNNSDF